MVGQGHNIGANSLPTWVAFRHKDRSALKPSQRINGNSSASNFRPPICRGNNRVHGDNAQTSLENGHAVSRSTFINCSSASWDIKQADVVNCSLRQNRNISANGKVSAPKQLLVETKKLLKLMLNSDRKNDGAKTHFHDLRRAYKKLHGCKSNERSAHAV